MSSKILIIEDDKKAAELMRLYLHKNGYQVLISHDGREGLDLARTRQPDLLVLDIMLPSLDGLDICRILRGQPHTAELPIIMLTAKSTEDDTLLGLDLGADDYMTKPFSPRELVARVRTVLKRTNRTASSQPAEAAVVVMGELTIHFTRHQVWRNNEEIFLTPKEFRLLEIMVKEPERPFSREELVEKAFGFDYEGLERTIDVHIMKLRKKIEEDVANPHYIHTVYGLGYKFSQKSKKSAEC